MLNGILELDGAALPDRRVLLISEDMTRLLASTMTNETGGFEFPLRDSESQSRVTVVAKIQGPVLAISHRVIDLAREGPGPHTIRIDSSSDRFHTLRGHVNSNQGWPPYLFFYADPVHLPAVPAPLENFFNTIDEQVVESWFFQQRIEGANFDIRVQQGAYRIDVHYSSKSRPQPEIQEVENYWMSHVKDDGGETAQFEAPFSSYLLQVDRDRSLDITVAPVRTEDQR